jgi:hypothetical protein
MEKAMNKIAKTGGDVTRLLSPEEVLVGLRRKWKKFDELVTKGIKARAEIAHDLLQLRQRVEAGELGDQWKDDWWGWFDHNFVGRKRRDVEKLLAAARAYDTEERLEEEAERNVAYQRAWRERDKQRRLSTPSYVRRSGTGCDGNADDADAPEEQPPETDGERAAFLDAADKALRLAEYSGPVDDEVITAAERVASRWFALADSLGRTDGRR